MPGNVCEELMGAEELSVELKVEAGPDWGRRNGGNGLHDARGAAVISYGIKRYNSDLICELCMVYTVQEPGYVSSVVYWI